MNLLQPHRQEVERVGVAVSNTFDAFSAKISTTWGIEHNQDGGHTDITADSVTADTMTVETLAVTDDLSVTGHLTAGTAAITGSLAAGSIVTATVLANTSLTTGSIIGSGGVLGVTGVLNVSSTANITGDVNVNTNTFNIVASTGNATAAGSILSSHATRGVGYTTGAGGTVAQLTSKATGVTLDKVTGQITMDAAALGGGAYVSFVVTNSAVATTDRVIVNVDSGGTANAYVAFVTAVGSGSFTITVQNITGGSLSEAPVIGFAVLKGVTS